MIMIKRTKIVATLSVQRCTEELVRSLFKAGMNIVRINSAHASLENAAEIIRMVRSVSNSIPVMLDTKGPEIRVTRMDDAYPDGHPLCGGRQGEGARDERQNRYSLDARGDLHEC